MAALKELTKRQEHLIAEMQQALYGKKSEKQIDDDRQLAFADLEIVLAEVDAQTSAQPPRAISPSAKRSPNAIAATCEDLPRIECVIEPDSL